MDSNKEVKEVKNEASLPDSVIHLPKRNSLHFSDGILDVDDLDEPVKAQEEILVDPEKLSWMPWMWYYTTFAGSKALQACDYMGEFLATFFGITTPKYQYELTEYNRMKEEEEENRKADLEVQKSWCGSINLNSVAIPEKKNPFAEEIQLKPVASVQSECK